jgi:aromatic ring hydroxylase
LRQSDAKGDRSLRPSRQPNPDTYVHVVERNARGIVISGTKVIVTGALRLQHPEVRHQVTQPIDLYVAAVSIATTTGSSGGRGRAS